MGEQGSTAAGKFADEAAFAAAVGAATLHVSAAKDVVSLAWAGRSVVFFPSSSTGGAYRLPTVGGKEIDVSPPFVYEGPHLNAALGARVVRASYGRGYALEYDFAADAVRRVPE